MKDIPFDQASIRALANILLETGLTEIEVAEKDSRIRVARVLAPAVTQAAVPPAPALAVAPPPGPIPTAAAIQDDANHPGAVLSPMVGVAYLSPEPGAAPYTSQGQTVAAGQTLLLIEAMKTFNQIKAPKSGTVARILVVSGAPVEYGEVLMVIE